MLLEIQNNAQGLILVIPAASITTNSFDILYSTTDICGGRREGGKRD
jgi:hypothetical protein